MLLKYNVAILGATGAVGQRFVELLQGHPWFNIEVLAASERSAGKKYKDACKWILRSEVPSEVGEMTVVNTDVDEVLKAGDVDLVFSALPGELAGPLEEEFAKHYPLVSKAKSHRHDEDVPLVVAEINPEHLNLIPIQKERRKYEGFITTDPNCSTIQLVLSLKPLEKFGIKNVMVSTMQALSGAGYPGVPSLDIIDNVIPYISGEEEKIEKETLKIMGKFDGERVVYADF
ncbi:MAG: aspartate-semialdehyde dehydrogenase, partial [Candidatus Bathyarchaeia archaeon]